MIEELNWTDGLRRLACHRLGRTGSLAPALPGILCMCARRSNQTARLYPFKIVSVVLTLLAHLPPVDPWESQRLLATGKRSRVR